MKTFEHLINQARLSPISQNIKLQRTAQIHSDWMDKWNSLSHRGHRGSSISSRVRAQNYKFSFVAENIALGYLTQEEVFQAWMRSTGHKRNMLHPKALHYGLAKSGRYWCLVLGRPQR